MANKRILLIEPGYRIISAARSDEDRSISRPERAALPRTFVKGRDKEIDELAWDRIYITTLFSFEYSRTADAIDYAFEVAHGQTQRIFVGGIAASLMHKRFLDEPRWRGIRFIKGLLDGAPATALQLDEFDGDFYADDTSRTPIEDLTPGASLPH